MTLLAATALSVSPAFAEKQAASLPLVHPRIGDSISAGPLKVKLFSKRQRYGGDAETHDKDIVSPKSVNVHPSGKKFYVNSLEGASTVVYSLPEMKKLAVIPHKFDASDAELWAPESGLFKFRHYSKDLAQLQQWQGVKWLTCRLDAFFVGAVGTTDFISRAEGMCQ